MKLIDAIKRVDRSKGNSLDPDYLEFCEELGITDYTGWNSEFCKRVQGYYLIKWLCTDTYVGLVAYYLDDEPVAVSMQNARKSDTNYEFINKEAAEKVRIFLLSLQEEETPTFSLMDSDEDIEETYTVEFTGQLLTSEGFVGGKPCKIVDNFKKDYVARKAIVEFEDGTTQTINIKDFHIPLALS